MFKLFPPQEHLDVWNHSARDAKLAYLVCLEMGLSRPVRQMVLQAALAHDLGKKDPDIAPLLKLPRRLTDEETFLVAEHADRSAEITRTLKHPLHPVVRFAIKYHNKVTHKDRHGDLTAAMDSEDFKDFSQKEQDQAQLVLYTLYAADFLDAVFDYSRSYQRDRPPFEMRQMREILGWMESAA